MKTTSLLSRAWAQVLIMTMVAAGAMQMVSAQSLADFGFQRMKLSNNVQSQRSLLVILAHFTDAAMAHDQNWFDDMVFNPAHQPRGVNAYFQTISNGRFSWVRGGTVWIDVSPSYRYKSLLTLTGNNGALADVLYASNLVYHAMVAFPSFCSYDTNKNGEVTSDELTIAIFTNDGGGASRWSGVVQPSGSTCSYNGTVAEQDDQGEFLTLCHELAHQLGTIDLYGRGDINGNLTLMGPTITWVPDDPRTWLLDPWHKLQLGWIEPRIGSLHSGGITNLPAAQLGDPAAPFLLYDPNKGPQEFWLLEYRTATCPNGNPYDTNVAGNGLVIWHIQQNATKDPVWLADAQFPAGTQTNWWYCRKCEGMHYLGSTGSPGSCPAGGKHEVLPGVNDYRLPLNTSPFPGEHGWRLCSKCQELFYSPNQASSYCAAGGTHSGSTSADYILYTNLPPYDDWWRRCLKCQGLFHPQDSNNGVCPALGSHSRGPTPYSPPHRMNYYTIAAEGAPNLTYGNNTVWASASTTPNLHLYLFDAAPTHTRIQVDSFTAGAGSITVEWLTLEDTWVDFLYTGFENGAFDTPFNTLAEGVQATAYGGTQLNTLHIKAGSRVEKARITKPMHIEAYGGSATVGR